MSEKSSGSGKPRREEIAARAFEIWEQEGRPAGREKAHWLRAERELTSSGGHGPGPATAPKSAPGNKRKSAALAQGVRFFNL